MSLWEKKLYAPRKETHRSIPAPTGVQCPLKEMVRGRTKPSSCNTRLSSMCQFVELDLAYQCLGMFTAAIKLEKDIVVPNKTDIVIKVALLQKISAETQALKNESSELFDWLLFYPFHFFIFLKFSV
ncbi:uncharacterized protein LOC120110523 [Phoenix dactylifera]|uniref:Uncharacterized protein LOC120110523 n=1 Tax=Phoenix dactylifera TaxID=42345 RepID=A0A8B9A7H6_PHODC|nr:uncharacterized protein LOC120110523 [Phoenix dactylifera]